MKTYSFTPHGVCSTNITFSLDDQGNIHDLAFRGGCNGNLKAISKLLEGRPAKEAADILRGNDCGGRGTSCADQLSRGLTKALEEAGVN